MANIKQATAYMDEAKKKGSKGIFNWSPDYDEAGDLYGKAAQIYRNRDGGQKLAVEAYELQAEMFEKCDHLGVAGKALENAGQMLYDSNQAAKGAPLMERAAKFYLRDNKAQQAATVMTRAARGLLDMEDPVMAMKAVDMLNTAIVALENDDKHILTKDLYRMIVLAILRANKPLDAIATLKKQLPALMKANNHDAVAKNCLEVVIICLHIGDGVLANRYMSEFSTTATGFAGSDEFNKAAELLSAFDERDQELLTEVGKSQLLSFLIPEVSRMAKKLRVGSGPGKAAAATAAAAGSGSGSPKGKPSQVDDDDEDIR